VSPEDFDRAIESVERARNEVWIGRTVPDQGGECISHDLNIYTIVGGLSVGAATRLEADAKHSRG
jgi:hypothetical protein